MIYDSFNTIGKSNITTTSTDFTNSTGENGIKDIIRKVLLGGNVRDITEFIVQRRLILSYAAMWDLFVRSLNEKSGDADKYTDAVTADLLALLNKKRIADKNNKKILDLWLLGLTKKGLDNIVRDEDNLNEYAQNFASSTAEAISEIAKVFGDLNGTITLNGKDMKLDWTTVSLLCIALGSQTLSIRGSAKSMNGKLFEKLILGCVLTIMGFKYCEEPPETVVTSDKLFWLSNMDENERETDATVVYNKIAISIDIGFIGKGNPEISLDKVSRFGRYKQIAGMDHEMKTIIIVDTVADGSDLKNKANRIGGTVLEMRHNNWVIQFANSICETFSFDHELSHKNLEELDLYLQSKIERININEFIK